MRTLLILSMALVAFSGAVFAQDNDEAGDMATRMNLAKMMHEIKPARGQVEAAIEAVAARLQPQQQQDFVAKMTNTFDFERLQQISTKAMAEVFTEAELQKMVDYFGSPEAQSISKKMPVYQSIMQPEITKMLDEAIIEVRTGAPSDIEPSETAPEEAGTSAE